MFQIFCNFLIESIQLCTITTRNTCNWYDPKYKDMCSEMAKEHSHHCDSALVLFALARTRVSMISTPRTTLLPKTIAF